MKCIEIVRWAVVVGLNLWLGGATPSRAEEQAGVRFFLVTCHKPSKVMIVDSEGRNRWEVTVSHPQDAAMLPDGTVLTSEIPGAKRFDRDKKVVWEYKVPAGCQNPVAQPLADGGVLVGNEGPCKLLEVDGTGAVKQVIQLATPFKGSHGQFRFCRKTPQGTYLVPFTHDGDVKEFDQSGKLIHEFPKLRSPVMAIRLPDRHTLVGAKAGMSEYDEDGKLVWQVNNENLQGSEKIDIVTGISRLKNGNTIAGNYTGNDSVADILEISPDKKVVWSLNLKGVIHIAAVQLLNDDLKPSDEVVAR